MEQEMWFKTPAKNWNFGLPIGNGHFGGMIPGNVGSGMENRETITLNEDTLWYGGYKDRNSQDALANLPEIRRLLFAGKPLKAQQLAEMSMSSQPKHFGAYQPLGKLVIEDYTTGVIHNYRRALDLTQAIVTVDYTLEDTKIRRSYFASYPDDVMVLHIQADQPVLDFSCCLVRRGLVDHGSKKAGNDTLIMEGACGEGGVQFACAMTARANGTVEIIGDYLHISGSSEATILLTAHPNFSKPNPANTCLEILRKTAGFSYGTLLHRHVEDYQALEQRVQLELDGDLCDLCMEERLARFCAGAEDNGLYALYYRFGRYLIIASSRPGSMAMNLQGIWSDGYAPPCECDYTNNINTQMNYWPVEAANLSECHEPLFDLLDRMLPHGQKTAKTVYGCNGFVAHHCTDVWGDTAVEGQYTPAIIWPMGGAWLVTHLMEHYRFTLNKKFLEDRAYPLLYAAALFFHEYMVADPNGYLVTGPSISPENTYVTPEGVSASLCMGPEMDMQIVRQTLLDCIECCEILGKDTEFVAALRKDLKQLRPTQLSSDGRILEWPEEYQETEPEHRHLSHLAALFPFDQINDQTPELLAATRKTLLYRLESCQAHNTSISCACTGFSLAWAVSCFARLRDRVSAAKILRRLLAYNDAPNFLWTILGSHWPMQIDASMGGAAAIMELLLQSQDGLRLLPALPEEWQNGRVQGLRARGGFTVDMEWQGGTLTQVRLHSTADTPCRIFLPEKLETTLNGAQLGCIEILSLCTCKNQEYLLTFSKEQQA